MVPAIIRWLASILFEADTFTPVRVRRHAQMRRLYE